MGKFILSIDQGTTSTRAILFKKRGKSFIPRSENSNKFFRNQDGLSIMQAKSGDLFLSVIASVLTESGNQPEAH